MDTADFLSAHAMLRTLPLQPPTRLAQLAQVFRLSAGETSNAAEREDMAIFVISGEVRISSLVEGRVVFHDVGADGAFGLLEALSDRHAPPASLLALNDAVILVAPANAAIAAIGEHGPAALALARSLAQLLDSHMRGADPLQLVYRDILRAAKPKGETCWTLDPMPRHRDLAQRVGVGEEEAASAIANLVRLGIARRRYPALDIENRDALKSLAI